MFLGGAGSPAWLALAEWEESQGNPGAASHLYQRAYTAWNRLASGSAERSSRMYGARYVLPDDVIPNGLLRYCLDSLAVARAFGHAGLPTRPPSRGAAMGP